MICSACGNEMGGDARFCSNCGRPATSTAAATPTPPAPVRSRLVRPRFGRMLGGVCAGFAQAYGWDVVLVRILLCVLVFFGCGAPVLIYFAAWIVMPNEPYFLPAANGAPGNG